MDDWRETIEDELRDLGLEISFSQEPGPDVTAFRVAVTNLDEGGEPVRAIVPTEEMPRLWEMIADYAMRGMHLHVAIEPAGWADDG
jgi:hypothetical protein